MNKKDILEVEYWSDSSSGSIRSQFDDAYYKMKPPPPKVRNNKILVIQAGKFPQSETALPNTATIPSQQKQISNYTNMAESSSKGRTNMNYVKAIKTVNTRQNVNRDYNPVHPHRNFTNESNMQQISNGTSSFYNGTNENTAEQCQNVTVNENFKRGTSYGGALSKSDANNREPHQYLTSRSSIANNNSNENYNLLSEPYPSPTSWNRMEEILSKRIDATHGISTNSQNIAKDKQSKIIEQAPPHSNTPRTTTAGRNQYDNNASVTTHPTSINSISPIGRHNLPSRKVVPASRNLNSRPLNRSETYNTFSAVQPTAQIDEGDATTTTEDTCFQILCFCFTCR